MKVYTFIIPFKEVEIIKFNSLLYFILFTAVLWLLIISTFKILANKSFSYTLFLFNSYIIISPFKFPHNKNILGSSIISIELIGVNKSL